MSVTPDDDPGWDDYYTWQDRRIKAWEEKWDATTSGFGYLFMGTVLSSIAFVMFGIIFWVPLVWLGLATFTAAIGLAILAIVKIEKGPPDGWVP